VKKILAVVLSVFFAFAIMPSAGAAAGESIENYAVKIEVTETGLLHITETIVYNFGENQRHGIFRKIPKRDYLPNDKFQPYSVEVKDVSQDANPAKYTISNSGDYLDLKIGSPDVTVSGTHTYKFDYVVKNGLKRIHKKTPTLNVGDVDFYWDVIGSEWDVQIAKASAAISFPGIPKKYNCTYGPKGSKNKCPIESNRNIVHVSAPNVLNNFEAMTVAVQVDKNSFTRLAAPVIKDVPVSSAREARKLLPYSLTLGVFTLIVVIFFAVRKRQSVVEIPIQDFVRFEPPAGLSPAELQAAWHGNLDAKGFTATLLDLSVRGVVALTLQGKHLVVTARDLSKPMSDWEASIVKVVLNGSQSALLDQYRADIATAVTTTSNTLVEGAVAKKYRNAQASRPRRMFVGLARVFGVGLIASLVWGSSPFISLVAVFAGFGFFASLISIFMIPKEQTKESADFLGEVYGFQKLLDTDAAEDRREYAQRSGLDPAGIFATMLPYAVIYELEKSWCAAFPDLTPAQLNNYGLPFVDTSDMGRSLETASHALAESMNPPTSSGSGGDGGSSGGGGGGGGGGSW